MRHAASSRTLMYGDVHYTRQNLAASALTNAAKYASGNNFIDAQAEKFLTTEKTTRRLLVLVYSRSTSAYCGARALIDTVRNLEVVGKKHNQNDYCNGHA